MRKILAFVLASAFFLTGCNTMNGLGKDVERLGEKVQQSSAR